MSFSLSPVGLHILTDLSPGQALSTVASNKPIKQASRNIGHQSCGCCVHVQAEYVEGVEKHDLETQATIERERITSAAVKQLKAEIKDEKSKHEEQV